MTKYLLLLAVFLLMIACEGKEDGSAWITDKIYAGLEWSPPSENEVTWYDAVDHCASIGGRLPNINELRKIIINCPKTEDAGICQISDPDCLSWDCKILDDCRCAAGQTDSYSALGDSKGLWLWSSSPHANVSHGVWYVNFGSGEIGSYDKNSSDIRVRCVR